MTMHLSLRYKLCNTINCMSLQTDDVSCHICSTSEFKNHKEVIYHIQPLDGRTSNKTSTRNIMQLSAVLPYIFHLKHQHGLSIFSSHFGGCSMLSLTSCGAPLKTLALW